MTDPNAPAPHLQGVGDLAKYDTSFFGHPRGLSTLFFTEMWERFSYYGMRALLLLYMTAPLAEGGLGFNAATGGAIYGLYTAGVYMMALPGGWIADRFIGQRRAVLYGGIIIAIGQFCLAVTSMTMFYLGLVLIVCGTGLLKGNVSVIVGQLYAPKDGRRDAAFTIFYMGINLGAFTAPLITGWLGQNINWHLGFAAAGVGMILGIIQYLTRSKYLGEAGLHPSPQTPEAAKKLRRTARLIAGTLVLVIAGVAVLGYTGNISMTPTQVSDAGGWFLLLVTLGFFGWLYFVAEWTADERKKLYVIGVLFIASALFWSVFEQAGSTLNLFADRNTNNSVLGLSYPSTWYQSLNACFIFIFAPVFAWLWIRLAKMNKEPSSPAKFSMGLVFAGLGFAILITAAQLSSDGTRVSPMWLIATYLMHTAGELSLSPVGLSAMTKLAPARIAGLMMGVWFLATAIGNYAGGRVAGLYESLPLPDLFTAIAASAVAAGLILAFFVKPIGRMLGERH